MEGYSNDVCSDDAESLLQPSPTAVSSKFEKARGYFWEWINTIVAYLSNPFGQKITYSKDTISPHSRSTVKLNRTASVTLNWKGLSSASKSTRIQRMIQRRTELSNEVEFDIESSRDHWSETLEYVGARPRRVHVAEANKEAFESLKKKWGGFFVDRGHLWVMGEKIAEGGQAEIFNATRAYPGKIREGYVLKVFKDGNALRDLQHQWPQGMLLSSDYSGFGFEHYATKNLLGGVLLKDGRFAFEMWKDWGDLRKLIDIRMEKNGNQCPPFTNEEVGHILLDIARGMKQLHSNKIVHRDLKASNVLIVRYKDYRGTTFTPANDNFHCAVADYECSCGVLGTGFWRAPEILLGLKNRGVKPSLLSEKVFTQKVDVYSYGMTCYEVLTGEIPFEEHPRTAYDVVLRGTRPRLPNHIQPIFKKLLKRCWLANPSERPSFENIVDDFEKFGIGSWVEPECE